MNFIIKSYKSPLVRNTLVYAISDGLNKAIPFLLLPFITRYLTPSDYGIVTNFNVYVQILSVFCYVSAVGSLPVQFFKLDKNDVCRYVSNMLFFNLISILACSIIALLFSGYIESVFNISRLFQIYALIVVCFAGITNVNMLLWRCEERPASFGIYQISQSAVNALTTVVFVIVMLLGWQGRVYSMMISTILFGFISIYIIVKKGYWVFKLDKQYLKHILMFAWPIVPHALSFWFRSGVDKIMLTEMCSLHENGIYSVALSWGGAASMFLISYSNAYSPWLFKKLAVINKDRYGSAYEQHKVVKIVRYSLLYVLLFTVIFYFASAFLINLLYDSSYFDSLYYLPWVILEQFFYGGYLLFVSFIHYTMNTKILGAITFTFSVFQIGLTYIFILWFGAIGVAVASALTSVLIFFFIAGYAMKVSNLPWFKTSKIIWKNIKNT